MARRLFRGRAFSENGWPYVDQGSCTWDEVVPGVWLQIQNGAPFTIMRAFARDFHAHVEPLRDYDSACWTQDNTVDTSNHPGGTGMDLNWNGADQKTFRYGITKERAYPGDKARKLDELLAFYEDVIYCGGYWSIRDWMHFQMGYGTYDSKADLPTEKTLDFIRRKIRPDGFSTFNRGGGTTVPNGASVLARATGIPLDRAERILPALREGLILAECNTFPRIAMFLAQTCWESDQYRATEEYANGPAHEERWIYKGRTWIQLTWRSAYEGFGKWCHARGLVNDPMVFVNNPRSLADLKWAGLGAAYYWTTTVRSTRKYPTLNEASDARDVPVATQIVNGGTTHLAERTAIYNRAIALGDELLQLVQEEDGFLSALNSAEQREVLDLLRWLAAPEYGELRKLFASRAMYRDSDDRFETLAGFVLACDAMQWEDRVEGAAMLGEPEYLERVLRLAAGRGPGAKNPDGSPRQWAINHARAVLADIEAKNPQALQRYLAQKGAA
ncbi:lysin A [Mycobacterium phage DirtyDunning]|nr:lysin A [Mycobacterium phage DirtyDunning]